MGPKAKSAVWSLALLAAASCRSSAPPASGPALPTEKQDPRQHAYEMLKHRLDTFHVSGTVMTADELLLPEEIAIEIRSEVCVESRAPGDRFWSLDYDTCFAFSAIDSVNEAGEYSVSVPCLDADAQYQSKHDFGELRLVQRGPVSFVAESDVGWRYQETFSSSRTQRRDVILEPEPDTFWVVRDSAEFRGRPRADSPRLGTYEFGTSVEVVRFHRGWAEIIMGDRIGWMEMSCLGTEEQVEARRSFQEKPEVKPLSRDDP